MKRIFLFLLLTVIVSSVQAQIDLPQIVPPSPNAAKLVQFDITPTSPYTGRQNLSVPLYSISLDGGQFPISLNYASGGVRTNEESSYVGLGWALSYGGTISRTVKSLNDIRSNGWIYDSEPIPQTYNPLAGSQGELDERPTTHHPFWSYISGGTQKDTEPDVFHYNFMGYSGSFVLSKGTGAATVAIKLEEDPAKVIYDDTDKSFTINTPEGFLGEFTVKEWVTSIGGSDPDDGGPLTGCELSQVDITQIMNTNRRAITTWYLSRVESPNGRELFFEYDVKANDYSEHISESALSFSEKMSVQGAWQTAPSDTHGCSYTVVEHIYPKRIHSTYNNLEINFTSASRDDMSALINHHIDFAQKRGETLASFNVLTPQRITGLTVTSNSILSSLNHTISLQQSYFNQAAADAFQMKRLKLDGVTIDDMVYDFEYENGEGDTGLPDKSTFGVDYWGYYNGKDSNTSLVPVRIGYTSPTRFYGPAINTYLPNDLFYYQTEDRKANFDYGKAGLLSKVTYPTGGYSIYEYEAHEYLLNGKEIIPVAGDHNSQAEGPKTSAQIVTDDEFSYSGFIFVGGSCNSSINLSYGIACANFFSGSSGTCAPLWADRNVPAVEVVNAATNQVVFTKWFGDLYEAIHSPSPSYSVTGTEYLSLPPGNYFLRARSVAAGNNGNGDPTFSYGVISASFPKSCETTSTYTIHTSTFAQEAGGARIKSIANYDRDNNIAAKRSYDYKNFSQGTQFSTGVLMNPLMNFSITQVSGSDFINFHSFMSGSVLSDGGAAMGSHIGYTWVREYFEGAESGNIGLRDYKYLNEPNVPGFYGQTAKSTYAHSNGQLDEMSNRSPISGQVNKQDNKNIVESLSGGVSAMKIDWLGGSPGIMEAYRLERSFVKPKQIVSETYLNGETLTQTVDYAFNDNFQLASQTQSNSNGEVLLTEYKYAADYTSAASILNSMVTANRIGTPIEVISKVNGTVNSAIGTKFKQVGNNYLPDIVNSFNTDLGTYTAPADGQNFSSVASYEARQEYKLYDGHGNIREYVDEAGVSTTILWGYGSVYPVAQIQNATYAEVSGLVSQSDLDTPLSQQELQDILEALRTNPALKKALVTTMTYNPGVGLLSQTTPNGNTLYYEYDTYGRLEYVKDRDDNILKKNEYVYRSAVN